MLRPAPVNYFRGGSRLILPPRYLHLDKAKSSVSAHSLPLLMPSRQASPSQRPGAIPGNRCGPDCLYPAPVVNVRDTRCRVASGVGDPGESPMKNKTNKHTRDGKFIPSTP